MGNRPRRVRHEVPLASPEQGVEPALLKKPKPLAMMRVTALRGIDLTAKDWNITSKASSDPFVPLGKQKKVAKRAGNARILSISTDFRSIFDGFPWRSLDFTTPRLSFR